MDGAIEGFEIEEKTAAGTTKVVAKKVRLYNKLQAILRLVDIGMGVHGKPTNQVNVQVNIDRKQVNQQAIDRLFSKYDPDYVPGSA